MLFRLLTRILKVLGQRVNKFLLKERRVEMICLKFMIPFVGNKM